jgi:hypothetical protein
MHNHKLTHLLAALSIFAGLTLMVQSQQITVNSGGVYSGSSTTTLNNYSNRNVLINWERMCYLRRW